MFHWRWKWYSSNLCHSDFFPIPTVSIFLGRSWICHENYDDSIEMKLEQIGWLILFVPSKTRFQNPLICDSGVLKCCLSLVWCARISQRLFAFLQRLRKKVSLSSCHRWQLWRSFVVLLPLGFTRCSGLHLWGTYTLFKCTLSVKWMRIYHVSSLPFAV